MIVADASPLIGLARIDLLSVLRTLYQTVLVPPQVLSELEVSGDRPGARRLASAIADGWLSSASLTRTEGLISLQVLDPGEAEAVLLAEERPGCLLLIDDRRGRTVARARGISIIGIGGVLLVAKRERLIERLRPEVDRLADAGYRLSSALRERLLELAGE